MAQSAWHTVLNLITEVLTALKSLPSPLPSSRERPSAPTSPRRPRAPPSSPAWAAVASASPSSPGRRAGLSSAAVEAGCCGLAEAWLGGALPRCRRCFAGATQRRGVVCSPLPLRPIPPLSREVMAPLCSQRETSTNRAAPGLCPLPLPLPTPAVHRAHYGPRRRDRLDRRRLRDGGVAAPKLPLATAAAGWDCSRGMGRHHGAASCGGMAEWLRALPASADRGKPASQRPGRASARQRAGRQARRTGSRSGIAYLPVGRGSTLRPEPASCREPAGTISSTNCGTREVALDAGSCQHQERGWTLFLLEVSSKVFALCALKISKLT